MYQIKIVGNLSPKHIHMIRCHLKDKDIIIDNIEKRGIGVTNNLEEIIISCASSIENIYSIAEALKMIYESEELKTIKILICNKVNSIISSDSTLGDIFDKLNFK